MILEGAHVQCGVKNEVISNTHNIGTLIERRAGYTTCLACILGKCLSGTALEAGQFILWCTTSLLF